MDIQIMQTWIIVMVAGICYILGCATVCPNDWTTAATRSISSPCDYSICI